MKAIVLVAGYATRLYPLTLNEPKALLSINSKPILNYIIGKIDELEDINEILIITNDRFYMKFVCWLNQNKKNFRKNIKIINDGTNSAETRLGGIGDLWFTIEKENIDDDIFVVLGDNLFDFNLQEIIDFFKAKRKTTAGIYDLHDLEEVKKMSEVKIKHGKVVEFEEKPLKPKTALSSIGIYIFSKEDLEKIKDYMKTDKPKDAPGFLIQDFCQKQDVYAFIFKGKWFDIGSKETYEKVVQEW